VSGRPERCRVLRRSLAYPCGDAPPSTSPAVHGAGHGERPGGGRRPSRVCDLAGRRPGGADDDCRGDDNRRANDDNGGIDDDHRGCDDHDGGGSCAARLETRRRTRRHREDPTDVDAVANDGDPHRRRHRRVGNRRIRLWPAAQPRAGGGDSASAHSATSRPTDDRPDAGRHVAARHVTATESTAAARGESAAPARTSERLGPTDALNCFERKGKAFPLELEAPASGRTEASLLVDRQSRIDQRSGGSGRSLCPPNPPPTPSKR
jgi:hypothetical protein